MATLCRLDVFLLFTFLNIISNSRYYFILERADRYYFSNSRMVHRDTWYEG